jgi:peptide methionine sulfoxide reductase MsrA
MSAEALYGVFFEDGGNTYLAAIFAARGEAESYAEREEEDRFVREVENGEIAEEDYEEIYSVEEVHPEWLDRFPGAWDQLNRGDSVLVSEED